MADKKKKQLPQTKFFGEIDISSVKEDAKKFFFERGHISAPNDDGVQHSLKDMIGQPIGMKEENGKTFILARLYDGPDKSVLKAQMFGREINNPKSRTKFMFKLSTGKLEPYPQGDKEKHPIWNSRMVLSLVPSSDPAKIVRLAPKNLDSFTMFKQPTPQELTTE